MKNRRWFLGMLMLVLSFGVAGADEVEDVKSEARVIAVVLGEEIRDDAPPEWKDYLHYAVWTRLSAKYVRENKLEPTEEEIEEFLEGHRRIGELRLADDKVELEQLKADLESDELAGQQREEKEQIVETLEEVISLMETLLNPPEERKQADRESSRRMAREWVTRWKVNKSLFEKYGGRVVFQQVGMEPYDAYRQFLKDQEKAGAFQILDEQLRTEYWSKWPEEPVGLFSEGEEAMEDINRKSWVEAVKGVEEEGEEE